MNARSFITLLRRETWEHRSLVWVPLVVATLIVVSAILSTNVTNSIEIRVDGEESEFFARLAIDTAKQSQLFAVWMSSLILPLIVVGLTVLFFYLLDALYAERKDRSILFWKSMPVSDTATVLSKAFTALVVVPLWIWLLSLVMGLLVFVVVALKVGGTPLAPLGNFHVGTWFALQATLLLNLLVAALWYAPIAAWLLLVSAWAKRAPFLWAVLPPALLALFEDIVFDTSHVAQLIAYRLTGFFRSGFGIADVDGRGSAEHIRESIRVASEHLSALPLLGELHVYTGLAAAAVLLHGAVRLRRWRDDA